MNEKIADQKASAPQIDNIEIVELLGKGGMSLVYKARQKQLDRLVAVKVLSKAAVRGEDGIKRFHNEAKLTSTLEHPNIVKTISFGVSKDGQPYLVMEYLEGLSLADDLKQNGRLKLQKFKDVFLPVLSALNQAHESGLIHRDIKPANIMICKSETGGDTVKLVDFGIAKVFGDGETEAQNLTKTGAVLGSPTYMSPEQCQGKALDGRSDLYSLACVMYETLSGEPPYSGDSVMEIMQKHCQENPPSASELSRKIDIRKELANVTLWGLSKDPAKRPQTASEFARKLNEVLERITLDKVPKLKNIASPASARNLPLIAMLLLSILVIAAATFFFKQSQQVKKADSLSILGPNQKEELQYQRLLADTNKTLWLAEQLEAMATKYQQKSDWKHATPLWRRALEVKTTVLGPNGLALADSLDGWANCCCAQDKYAEAESLYKRALAIREKALKPNTPAIAFSQICLGDCFFRLNKYKEAEFFLERALAPGQTLIGQMNLRFEQGLVDLGTCYYRQARYAKAAAIFQSLLAIEEKHYGADSKKAAIALEWLANSYKAMGEEKKAATIEKRCKAIRSKLNG